MRFVIFCVLLFASLNARENPFKPVNAGMNEQSIEATNEKNVLGDFESKKMRLPSQARVLKYVTLGYQILDGSIKELRVPVDKNIDWHKPLVLGLKDSPVPMQTKKLEKSLLKVKKRPSKTKTIGNNIALKKLSTPVAKDIYSKKLTSFFSFDINGKTLAMHTKDKLIRDFAIANPNKLVFDFQTNTSFYTKIVKIDTPPFVKVELGSHKGYYRIVFLLDGAYTYTLSKLDGKILVKLN